MLEYAVCLVKIAGIVEIKEQQHLIATDVSFQRENIVDKTRIQNNQIVLMRKIWTSD